MTPPRTLFPDELHTWLPGVSYLPGFADVQPVQTALDSVLAAAPLRRMQTRRGYTMAVSTTSCGALGWVSDRRGYRYSAVDPDSGLAWPAIPEAFRTLAARAAELAGYPGFEPDSCLVNRYGVGCGMGAHQDRDEQDFTQPIVSVSLGLPARFFMIGPERQGASQAIDLHDGDVVVFGGEARLHYHGVRKLKAGLHPRTGEYRYNLTFRRAG